MWGWGPSATTPAYFQGVAFLGQHFRSWGFPVRLLLSGKADLRCIVIDAFTCTVEEADRLTGRKRPVN